jgi:PAS domain S-box-containing protein
MTSPDPSRDFFNNPTLNPLDLSNILIYRRLIEDVPSGIFIANQHQRIVYANHALSDLLGLPTIQTMMGMDIYSELMGELTPRSEFIQRLQNTSQIIGHQIHYKRKDGQSLLLALSAKVVRDDRNAIAGSEGVVTDMTEPKRLSDRLLHEKQKLETLLTFNERVNAIHDLDALIAFVVDETAKILSARKCSIMLLDDQKGELTIRGSKGIDQEFIDLTRIKIGEDVSGLVAKEGKPILVKNIEYDAPFRRATRSSYKTRSFMTR